MQWRAPSGNLFGGQSAPSHGPVPAPQSLCRILVAAGDPTPDWQRGLGPLQCYVEQVVDLEPKQRAANRSDDPIERRSFSIVALVLGAAVLVGFTLLPRLAQTRSGLVGKPAPEFALEQIDHPGDRVRLSDLKGKAVVLSFWASWCHACQLEAPAIDRLAKRMHDRNVAVIGVNTSDQLTRAVDAVRKRNSSYTYVFDDGSEVAERYGVESLPTLVIIDKNGTVTAVRTGLADEGSVEALVSAAL